MNKKNVMCLCVLCLVCFLSQAMVSIVDNVSFKPVRREDVPLLRAWFIKPHVTKWWPAPEVGCDDRAFAKFLFATRDDVFPYIMIFDGRPIGYIQYYLVNPESEKHAWLPQSLVADVVGRDILGIDLFIGEEDCCGKGLGQLCIKKFVDFLLHLPTKIGMIIIDPDPVNIAAISCYAKAGFEQVGEFTTPDGPALLMIKK